MALPDSFASTPSSSPRASAPAATIVAAGLLLIAPIVLWALFGDGDPLHAAEVALGAAILCWAVGQRSGRGSQPAPAPAPPARSRPVTPPAVCNEVPDRPAGASRLSRDVGCAASENALERRSARRRTRP